MAPGVSSDKSRYLVDARTLVAGGVALVVSGVLVALFLWMVAPAAAREVKAACAGLRPTLSNPALCPEGQDSCTLPQPAPDFTVTAHDGRQIQLSQFRGKVVLLNFWASWCAVCKAEKPSLRAMSAELSSDDYVVVTLASDAEWAKVLLAIALAHNPAQVPDKFKDAQAAAPTMEEALSIYGKAMPRGTPYQVFLDQPSGDDNLGQVAQRWGIEKVPESFLIDREGRIRYYFVNKRDWTASVAATCIRSLVDE
ncbi:MAG: redoxin domain-containing protein [Kofleriaceae bacterium]|jgi:peroxiredoxin|nr:redoxin domain-containing protein [Kofleriaceae bacterium]MBP6839237.1 redoxin domain-containing protein [Kofleriaceae bacterium]MBP9206714.1 redoxin domain-containing protein [Kofleriaceae bacterium]